MVFELGRDDKSGGAGVYKNIFNEVILHRLLYLVSLLGFFGKCDAVQENETNNILLVTCLPLVNTRMYPLLVSKVILLRKK